MIGCKLCPNFCWYKKLKVPLILIHDSAPLQPAPRLICLAQYTILSQDKIYDLYNKVGYDGNGINMLEQLFKIHQYQVKYLN